MHREKKLLPRVLIERAKTYIVTEDTVSDEQDLFREKSWNPESIAFPEEEQNSYGIFKEKLIALVKDVMGGIITSAQQDVMDLFNMNIELRNMSSVLQKSDRNVYYRYWNTVINIRHKLCRDSRFVSLINEYCPKHMRNRMMEWVEEQKNEYPYVTCPICDEIFHSKIKFKNHLIRIRCHREYSEMDKAHLEFVKEQEEMIENVFEKEKVYRESWAKRLCGNENFYLGKMWIYNYCKRRL